MLHFIETAKFTKQIKELLSDDEYTEFQEMLIKTPEIGDLIRGTGGLRKVRYSLENTGKSDGIRVIYYYYNTKGKVILFVAYPKSKKINITAKEKQALAKALNVLKEVYDE